MEKLTHQEIVSRQKEKQKEQRLPFCAVLNNIRSLYNVGSIFRTADGAGVEKLWLCGITGHPPSAMIAKTALGAEHQVEWEHQDDCLKVIRQLKAKGYQIIFLEQTKKSILYQKFVPNPPVCLVLGNEISGVSHELLKLCDEAVEIEMRGLKNSLNVSVAFGIVAYHIANSIV
ncbi:MAG: RNA methyltransferase [Candidatus Omnitrophica bacterium]|nr:RNA methyltransferase [Candidatus Omnitrophota bacterium]